MAAEGTSRQSQARRDAARAIVAERAKHEWNGLPDWHGNSRSYMAVIDRAYREAGVPTDKENPKLHAGLRVGHILPVVREMAPTEDLEALRALRKPREAPRSRSKASVNGNVSSMPTVLQKALDDPVAMVSFAIRALQGAVEAKPSGLAAQTVSYLLPAVRQAVDDLSSAVANATD